MGQKNKGTFSFLGHPEGFTLVELIVVITILAVLWTIAFISFQWNSANARNSVRKNDINKIMNNAVEIYKIKTWFNPATTNWVSITYSWAELWTQWHFWEQTRHLVWNLSKVPIDPLTEWHYTYSRLKDRMSYEIAAIIEWDKPESYVQWSYNRIIMPTTTWGIDYVLAVPSILTSNIISTDINDILSQGNLVYNGYTNSPSSYYWTRLSYTWWFVYTPNNLIVYSWSINDLVNSQDERIKLLKSIQLSYSWTIVKDDPRIRRILNEDIDTANPSLNTRKTSVDVANWLRLKLINF